MAGRVTDELGGKGALEIWTARRAQYQAHKHERAQTPQEPLPYIAPDMEALRRGEVAPAPILKPVPTDAAGWFRLAPIGRVMRPRAKLTDAQIAERCEARFLQRTLCRQIWDALPMEEKFGRPFIVRKETLHDTGAPEDWVFDIRPIPVTAEELAGNKDSLILRPHEVRGLEGREGLTYDRSFETPAGQAPQDEGIVSTPPQNPP